MVVRGGCRFLMAMPAPLSNQKKRRYYPACYACRGRRRNSTEQNSERGSMSDFLSEMQSDELARCEEYQEWLELRRLEAIESMEQEAEND